MSERLIDQVRDRRKKGGPPIKIDESDRQLVQQAQGLISLGYVRPAPRADLGPGDISHGHGAVNVLLNEVREEETVERHMAAGSKARADELAGARRVEPKEVTVQSGGTPDPVHSQRIMDDVLEGRQRPPGARILTPDIPKRIERGPRDPKERMPETVKRRDIVMTGRWADKIASGEIKLVD